VDEIKLNRWERKLATALGKAKAQWCRDNQAQSTMPVAQREAAQINGYARELAVAKLLNLYPSFSDEPDRWDLVLPCGRKLDVKGSDDYNGNLLLAAHSKSEADVYVLCNGVPDDHFEIWGWVFRERMLRDWWTHVPEPCYGVLKCQLEPTMRALLYMRPEETVVV